jgi:hypothetical protein
VPAQDLGGLLQQALDRRIVGLDEGSDHLRHMPDAAPLVAGQQLDRHVETRDRFPGRCGDQMRGRRLRLRQAAQQGAVQGDIELRQAVMLPGADAVYPPRLRRQERRFAGQRQIDAAERIRAVVDQRQFAQHRYGILVESEAEAGCDRRLDAERRRVFRIGGFVPQIHSRNFRTGHDESRFNVDSCAGE